MSIEQTVWSFLKGSGLPEQSVAAVMGNIEAESEFNESLIEQGNGIGFGLCQWSFERRRKLESYGTDLTHQLNFLWAELTGNIGNTGASLEWINKSGYLSHNDFMFGEGSIADLTAAMCFCWERPNAAVAHLERRQNSAQKYFSQFTGTAGSPSANTQQAITIESTSYEVIKGSERKGDILYGRRYRIVVSDKQGNALDVSQLRCTFSITKTIQMEPNYSEINIYNLNTETENTIIMNGSRVTVEAGYEGTQFGLIFDGDILQTIREKEDGTTYKLTIIALDSDRAINFDIVNYSILKGQTARTIVEHIVNKAEYPISLGNISSSLDNGGQTLSRGKVFFGKSSDYLRQLAQSHDAHYYMEDGKLNIVKMDDLPEGEIFDLSSTSGLVGTPEQTEYGVSGQCLINPAIKVNTLIHVDNSLVRARRLDINGGSFKQPPSAGASTSDTRSKIIAEAKRLCDDPNVGYSQAYRNQTINGITYHDCSSFVKHCYEIAGLSIDDITNPQWAQVQPSRGGKVVDISEAKAGDIVFWFNGNDCYHVAIYGGNNDLYAARTDNKPLPDQVAYIPIYGQYKIGRPKCLIDADNGQPPSSNNNSISGDISQAPPFRALDKDGIYRVIKITYQGDTRGDDWYCNFETIDQVGGAIPAVTS